MRILISIVAVYLLLAAPGLHARAGWIDRVEVVELIATNRHYYEIRLQTDGNPSNCREKQWFYVNYEARGADEMFDLFVDAVARRLKLRVYVTGVCNFSGYSEISSVSARPN